MKGLDSAHEALAGIALDPETLREWKAGYASSGVHRGRLALPIIGSVAMMLALLMSPVAAQMMGPDESL